MQFGRNYSISWYCVHGFAIDICLVSVEVEQGGLKSVLK